MGTEIRRARRGARAGSALVFVLFIVTGMMLTAIAFSRLSLQATHRTASGLDDKRAFHLAEAGLTESMVAIRGGGTGNVGRIGQPARMAGGLFWSRATPLTGNLVRIDVTAMAGRGRSAVEAVIEDNTKLPLFVSVLNSREQLTLAANVVIDSFDSAVSDYASQATNVHGTIPYAGANGDVASNEDIVLNSGAHVFGDATPGPGHAVSLAAGTYVSGSIAPGDSDFSFPPLAPPAIAQSGPFTVSNNGNATLGPGTFGYTDLGINRNGRLVVQGPATIVVDNFTGGKDARLEIDATNGPVTFFVRDTYTHTNGFEAVPAAGSPMAVAFLLDSTNPILFPASSNIRGAYYAPNADVTMTNTNEVWGSIAANRISMASSTRFHFDETLIDHWKRPPDDPGLAVRVLYWRPTVVTPNVLRIQRGDPFALLGVDPRNLPGPEAAWDI